MRNLLLILVLLFQPLAGAADWQARLRGLMAQMVVFDPQGLLEEDRAVSLKRFQGIEESLVAEQEIPLDLIRQIASTLTFGEARIANWGRLFPTNSAFHWYASLQRETTDPMCRDLFPGFRIPLPPGFVPPFTVED